jgi:hypothetical protein
MVVILSTTIITCTQAFNLINKVSSVVGLTEIQKKEIILELKKVIPSCPVKITNKEK